MNAPGFIKKLQIRPLRVKCIARLYDVTAETVRGWIKNGKKLPHLRVKNVARLFDVTAETVRNWIKNGKARRGSTPRIKAVKVGGQYRIPFSEVSRTLRVIVAIRKPTAEVVTR